jgi:hypothetical protein
VFPWWAFSRLGGMAREIMEPWMIAALEYNFLTTDAFFLQLQTTFLSWGELKKRREAEYELGEESS